MPGVALRSLADFYQFLSMLTIGTEVGLAPPFRMSKMFDAPTRRRLVPDSGVRPGDVLVFVPNDATGLAIDVASADPSTGFHGYSHCGLVCGGKMLDVDNTNDPTVPQVEAVDLQVSLQRGHVACRFPLSYNQVQQLCPCVVAQVGEGMDALELVTFGALHEKGRELCTMLIMHCLDKINFNRAAMGLGGFVSPNAIAHAFGAPGGDLFGEVGNLV
jgi:hypothetical protein